MEELEPSPQYQKGFNVGYQIAKVDPDLFKQLEKSLDRDDDYIHGLKMGKKQLDREMLLEQVKQARQQSKDRDNER